MNHTDCTLYNFSAEVSRATLTGVDPLAAAPSIRGALRFTPVLSWCFWLPTTETKNWISCQQTTDFTVTTCFVYTFKNFVIQTINRCILLQLKSTVLVTVKKHNKKLSHCWESAPSYLEILLLIKRHKSCQMSHHKYTVFIHLSVTAGPLMPTGSES